MVRDKVCVHKVSIPYLREFAHSRSKKTPANNIVVEIIAEQGEIVGYGEGAPRLGVTGETQENAIDSIGHFLKQAFRDVKSILEAKPVFHQRDENIRGHVFYVFLPWYSKKSWITTFIKQAISLSGLTSNRIQIIFKKLL